MVSGLLIEYPLHDPDYVWNSITPRQATSMLEYAFKYQTQRDMRLVTIYHAEKPRDLHRELSSMIVTEKVIKLKDGEELSGVLRLAMAMGTEEDVAKIQHAQSKINRRKKALDYIDRQESSEDK